MAFSFANDPVFASIAATKPEYKRLGKSGLKVSFPILGTMGFGDKGWLPWATPEEEALPLLKAAYDKGLNTWDTANVYSNGLSEEIIGRAIKKYEIPREKVVLLTKIWSYVGDTPSTPTMMYGEKIAESKDFVNRGGLSRSAIFTAVDACLKRLQTDYIDVLQIHRFDPNTPVEETMEALHDVVKSGKARYIGASSMDTYQFITMQFVAEKNGWTKFASMQNHYSLLYREEEREMNKFCKETGVGLLAWSPFGRGYLVRPNALHGTTPRSEEDIKNPFNLLAGLGTADVDRQIIDRVEEIAKKRDWKMSHVALAWLNKRVASAIIGFGSVDRMDENCDVKGKVLTDEEEKYLEELYVPRNIMGH
ncbi:hypothetical protein KVT40_004008 [Elsinoe batatas]|uniref:NADP-dependent oxidoreductase domain-containing protein n=1 Tax=Elsinoe batatas TaxID=2601811 RepID=A0A8K0L625_9PEZI|nr:hypothetical protein KVT40_004008 [Elsinoe batatas]